MKSVLFLLTVPVFLFSCSSDENELQDDEQAHPIEISLTTRQASIAGNTLAFSNRLMRELLKTDLKENVLVSPFSLQMMLGMMSNAAAEKGISEIVSALGLTGYSLEELNDFNKRIAVSLEEELENTINYKNSNGIWISNMCNPSSKFLHNLENSYNASVQIADFTQQESLFEELYMWSKEKTNGMIINAPIGSSDLNPAIKCIAMNATMLNGKWKNRFATSDTKVGAFKSISGKMSKTMMMKQVNELPYYQNENIQAVTLLMGNGSLGMTFILPREGVDIEKCFDNNEWLQGISSSSKVNLTLPRFDLSVATDFIPALKELGLNALLEDEEIFQTGLGTEGKLLFTNQMVNLKVNEEGAAASVVTAGGNGLLSDLPSKILLFDRPFGFFIQEMSTKIVLFSGVVVEL